MATNDKVLNIAFKSDISEVSANIKQLSKEATDLGITLHTTFAKTDAITGETVTSLQLVGQELQKLRYLATNPILASASVSEKTTPHADEAKRLKESLKRAEDNRKASADIFRTANTERLAELNRVLALESSIRVNGKEHIKTIELKAAFDELAIKKNLNKQLLELENKLLADTTTNRLKLMSEVNKQRKSFMDVAQAQITTNRETLEAAQLQAKQAKATSDNVVQQKHLIVHLLEVISVYKLMNTAITFLKTTLSAIPTIGIQKEATMASLTATMGGSSGAGSALVAINAEAQRTGITIDSLRDSFRGFQASTSLAGESLQSTWRMFTNINTVATTLHLTTDQTKGVFLALAQIFNKTKVQSEELVKQLGNLLPGAFASFAAANKDMFTNSADLITKMKAGVVTAHDTMEKFTAYLAGRFVEGFSLASDGLNANIGRMKNSFTLLGETIYTISRGAFVDTVKSITSITNAINEDIKGANNLGTILQTGLNIGLGVVVASLGSYLAGLTVAITTTGALSLAMETVTVSLFSTMGAVAALEKSLAFLISPVTIIAGIVAIGAALLETKAATEKAKKAVDSYIEGFNKPKKEKTKGSLLQISVDKDQEVIAVKEHLKNLNETISKEEQKYKSTPELRNFSGIATELKLNYKRRENLEKILVIATEEAVRKEKEKQELLNYTSIEERSKSNIDLEIKALQAQGKTVEAERIRLTNKYSLEYRDKVEAQNILDKAEQRRKDLATPVLLRSETTQRRIEEEPAISKEVEDENKKAIENYNIILANVGKAGYKERRDTQKQELKLSLLEEQDGFKKRKETLIAESKNLDVEYSRNILKISDYVTKKKILLDKEAQERQQTAQREFAMAGSSGDVTRQEKIKSSLATELNRLKQQGIDISNKGDDEAIAYGKQLELQEAHLLELQGKKEEADKQAMETQRSLFKARMEAEGSTKGLDQYNKITSLTGIHDRFLKSRIETGLVMTKHQDSIDTISKSEAAGVQGTLSGELRKIALRKETIALLEKQLVIQQKLAGEQKKQDGQATPFQKKEILDTTDAINKLKAEGTSTFQLLGQQITSSVDQPLTQLLTGAQNARQAFHSFAISVEQDLAQMVVNEMKSLVLKGLTSAGGSLFNSFTTSGLGASGIPLMSAMNPLALGGFSFNKKLSSLSGTILDSPTIIPFASGAALAGEAGAEAIMPLTRLSDGKLGVKSSAQNITSSNGSSGGSGVHIGQMHIHVQAANDSTPGQQSALISNAIRKQLTVLVRQNTVDNLRSGNILNPTSATANTA